MKISIPTTITPSMIPIRRLLFLKLPASTSPKIPTLLRLARRTPPDCEFGRESVGASSAAELGAVVTSVSVVVIAGLPFGVSVGFVKLHVVFEGSVPQVNVTVPL